MLDDPCSFLLNAIISELRADYEEDFNATVAVTAATGIAATHIAGSTIHSVLGTGAPRCIEDFQRMWKKENRDRLKAFKVGGHQLLIIRRNVPFTPHPCDICEQVLIVDEIRFAALSRLILWCMWLRRLPACRQRSDSAGNQLHPPGPSPLFATQHDQC